MFSQAITDHNCHKFTYVCHGYFSFVIVHYATKNIFWTIMAHVIETNIHTLGLYM